MCLEEKWDYYVSHAKWSKFTNENKKIRLKMDISKTSDFRIYMGLSIFL